MLDSVEASFIWYMVCFGWGQTTHACKSLLLPCAACLLVLFLRALLPQSFFSSVHFYRCEHRTTVPCCPISGLGPHPNEPWFSSFLVGRQFYVSLCTEKYIWTELSTFFKFFFFIYIFVNNAWTDCGNQYRLTSLWP